MSHFYFRMQQQYMYRLPKNRIFPILPCTDCPHEAERASSTSMTNCMPSPELDPRRARRVYRKQNFYPRSIFQVNHYKLNNFISTFIFLFRFALICTCSSAIHNTNTRERGRERTTILSPHC